MDGRNLSLKKSGKIRRARHRDSGIPRHKLHFIDTSSSKAKRGSPFRVIGQLFPSRFGSVAMDEELFMTAARNVAVNPARPPLVARAEDRLLLDRRAGRFADLMGRRPARRWRRRAFPKPSDARSAPKPSSTASRPRRTRSASAQAGRKE
jgi:hypothetical protein